MTLAPASITFQGREWSGEALATMAAGWHARVRERLPAAPEAVAMVARSHPETFALLLALSALPVTVVLLHPEPATWRSGPPVPVVMPVCLALARRTMPPWLQPAVVAVRAVIPALVTGKHDREACIRLLETELGAAPDAP